MAKIGLLKPVYAPITSEPENAAIVYGTGKSIGNAMTASVTFTRNDAPLYAEDALQEYDNGVTGAEIGLGVDDVTEETQVAILGMSKTGTAGSEEYEVTEASAPYVGVGFIQVKKKGGVVSYLGNWFHKVQFSMPDETTNTKGEKLEWQTPSLKGKAFGVYLDNTGVQRFKSTKPFATLAAARTWLEDKANIASGS